MYLLEPWCPDRGVLNHDYVPWIEGFWGAFGSVVGSFLSCGWLVPDALLLSAGSDGTASCSRYSLPQLTALSSCKGHMARVAFRRVYHSIIASHVTEELRGDVLVVCIGQVRSMRMLARITRRRCPARKVQYCEGSSTPLVRYFLHSLHRSPASFNNGGDLVSLP